MLSSDSYRATHDAVQAYALVCLAVICMSVCHERNLENVQEILYISIKSLMLYNLM